MDKDIDVMDEELGESIEAADAVLDRSDTEVGEDFPSPLGSIVLGSSFKSLRSSK